MVIQPNPSSNAPPRSLSRAAALLVVLTLGALTGCERLGELAGVPDPKKAAAATEAEGRAIGSACRHSGRALEDCYLMNPTAPKSSIFAGWKEMNDYMTQNNLEVVPSRLPAPALMLPRAKAEEDKAAEHPAEPDKTTAKADPTPADTETTPKTRRRYRRSEG